MVAVLTTSWLVTFDWQVMFFRPYKQWPEIHAFLDYFVVLGQRGPTAVMVAAWLGWRCWRQRTLRPLLMLGASLLLLNITVGAAKLGMGRLGPHYATTHRLQRDVAGRRHISLRPHRERRGHLGRPGLPGHHPAAPPQAVGDRPRWSRWASA